MEWSLPQEENLLSELQQLIFAEAEGPCLPPGYLAASYGKAPKGRLSNRSIAHLVSCCACLKEAASILGLADLTSGITRITES